MKKLAIHLPVVAMLILAGLTSFSAPQKHASAHSYPQVSTDTTLLPLFTIIETAEDPITPTLDATYTVCTSEACFPATLPDVAAGEAVLPGMVYTVCTFEACFLATFSETIDGFGMPLLVMEDKKAQ